MNQDRQSITETLQGVLEDNVHPMSSGAVLNIVQSTNSILNNALSEGLTLQQYVTKYKEKAVQEAEACLNEWLKIQSMAAIQGSIETDQGSYQLSRNMTALIKERVLSAEKQLDKINEYYFTSTLEGEKRRDHITRVLYNRAVHKGDTRALTYLIDRVDGKPTETSSVGLDYDNDYNVYKILHTLFKQQLQVLNSGNGTKLVCCSRRAGKSHLCCAILLIEALRTPNTNVLYVGECWAPDTLLRKYDGSLVRADSVKVGDVMMGASSEPQTVLELGNGEDEMYRIVSHNGGIDFTCNSRHILTLKFTHDPLKAQLPQKIQDKYHFEQDGIYDIPLNEYMQLPEHAKRGLKLFRQCTEYPAQKHFIDPYLLGLWLGDGHKHCASISIGVDDIDAQEHHLKCLGIEMGCVVTTKYDRGDHGCFTLSFRGKGYPGNERNLNGHNPMIQEMVRLNIRDNKHIPQEYLIDSVHNRLKLLAGLIDSDGSVGWRYSSNGTHTQELFFHNSDKKLFDQVLELANSLGFRITWSSRHEWNDTVSYTMCIKGELSAIPTRLERKELYDSEGYMCYGFDVVSVGRGPYNGFVLDGNGRCLLADYTVTHNTLQLAIDNIIDPAMNKIIDGCQLRDKKGKRLDWKKLDNGSQITVRGLSNTKDPDQIRGAAAKVIVIDEFFHLKSHLLEYMIQQVLEPMQMDYADDYQFICVGTPPSIKDTYGEKAWKEWDVPHFTWNWRDNPYPSSLEAREKIIEDHLKEKGLTWESSYARREYNGEWIYDEDLLLYPEFHTYDPFVNVPLINVDMVLFGIDYGVSDSDTLVGIAWDTAARKGYIFHEDKFNRLDIKDHTISQLQYLEGQIIFAWRRALDFFPNLNDKEANKRIIWVADDNDQHLTDHFNINCRLADKPEIRINIMNAHKTDTVYMQDKIRDLLRTGNLLLPVDGKTVHECMKTVLLRGPAGQVYPEIDNKAYHPDLLPAIRYALWLVIGQEKVTQ